MTRKLFTAAGLALVVAGVAVIYWPAAVILAGLALIGDAHL
jgi:uncharacterized membrane protein HdeD (DUF308 family)